MPIFARVCLCIFCLACAVLPLVALTTEYSASASSLSGLTLLSISPADNALSPLIGVAGITASWQTLYGISSASVYGLHSAFPLGQLFVATGINYLNNPDYRWQDEYLGVSAKFAGIKLGATQHLIYEKIEEQSWLTWDNDYAISVETDNYGSEIRWNNSRSNDSALTLSALSKVNKTTSLCTAYTWRKEDSGSYSVASSNKLATPLTINCSWQSNPARFGFGLNVFIGKLSLLYAVRTHPELNLTHSVGLGSAW